MMTLDINGMKAVMDKLEGVVKAIGSPKEALEETGDFLVSEYEKNFPEEGARHGDKWQELKEATKREKMRLGYGSQPILVRTGELMKGFAKEVSQWSVRVFNPTKYFRYHQLGEGDNPKRTMISRTENLSGGIFEIFNKYIRKNLGL